MDTKKLVLFVLGISFLFLSCSDELQLEPSSSDLTVKEDTNKEAEAYAEDSMVSNETDSQNNSELDTILDESLYSKSLDEIIDELAVSDDDKSFLKTFIDGIKQELNLDDSSLINAILKGGLDDLGLNNEDIQAFLFDLALKSIMPPEVTIFLEILKALDIGSGSGSSGFDLGKLASLLFSDNLKSFVEEHLLNGDKLEILKKITEFISKLSSRN